MTWRWNAFSMRLTPTRPSRTRRELSREGTGALRKPSTLAMRFRSCGPGSIGSARASCSDHVGPGDPVLQSALLAVEAHPQEPEEQRHGAGEVPRAACHAACRRRPVAVDVDDLDVEHAHAERLPDGDLEHEHV